MKRIFAFFALLTATSVIMCSCAIDNTRETAVTAAKGPADTALPYQALFVVNENADERLILAAKSFCDRAAELSQGGLVFTFILSENPLHGLQTGKADVILLENAAIPAFSPMSEAFRYKNYEHFTMSANSSATLSTLSDILGAYVFAGFYAGSDIILSHGTLDSRFKPTHRASNDEPPPDDISVAAFNDTTANAFSLLNAEVLKSDELDERIAAFSNSGSAIELSPSELASPALLKAVRASFSSSSSSVSDGKDDDSNSARESEPGKLEAPVMTRAFTGIKPVWMIFAQDSYEKLSQTNRAAVAEAVAYMLTDIDGVYLKYEQEKIDSLVMEDVPVSPDFAASRAQVLRLADEQSSQLTVREQKLREIISRIQ